jgi:hypothetical protein
MYKHYARTVSSGNFAQKSMKKVLPLFNTSLATFGLLALKLRDLLIVILQPIMPIVVS